MTIFKIKKNIETKEMESLEENIKQFFKDISIFSKGGVVFLKTEKINNDALFKITEKYPFLEIEKDIEYKLACKTKVSDFKNIIVEKIEFSNKTFQVIAGPCAVESEDQIIDIAIHLKEVGVTILRGGAFKPRSSPYSFQGLGKKGIELLIKAKEITGLPIVTEIIDTSHIELFEKVDIIQVGARNMQNYSLLKELGRLKKPILLKRGFGCTIKELIMSAEYILKSGNPNVIFCERGIRTFETSTRNTLDISAIPILKKETNLPVVVDPSHAAGRRDIIQGLTDAAIAVGADGVMIEVHNNRCKALSDGEQSLDYKEFATLIKDVKNRVSFEKKHIGSSKS